MALTFEYLSIKNATDAEISNAGSNGWRLILWKGSDAWFTREVII